MLLPLPASISRDRSLGHHLALVALRTGNGNVKLVGRLLRTLYIAYFVHEVSNGHHGLSPFRISDTALQANGVRARRGENLSLSAAEERAIEQVLLLHDDQLAAMPSHEIVGAEIRLKSFLATDTLSPIAPDDDRSD
jgi:hypothetical protein